MTAGRRVGRVAKLKDLTGKRFGKLVALERLPVRRSRWLCKCDCGSTVVVFTTSLTKEKPTQSCGCLNVHKQRPFEYLFNVLTEAAKRRGISLELSYEDFVKFTAEKVCHYCYSPIKWTEYNGSGRYNLDRTDSSLGYSKDNVVVCCTRCNLAKADRFSYKEWYCMTAMFRRDSGEFSRA